MPADLVHVMFEIFKDNGTPPLMLLRTAAKTPAEVASLFTLRN